MDIKNNNKKSSNKYTHESMFGHIMTSKVKPELDKKSSWRAYPQYKKVKPDKAPCFISIDVYILVQQKKYYTFQTQI